MRRVLFLVLLLLAAGSGTVWGDACVECHRIETPAAVQQWQQSAHFGKAGCALCHGDDHEAILHGEARVTAAACADCHRQAYDEHSRSKHGLGLHAGWGCTRNLPQRDPRECRFCHEEGSSLPVSKVQCARFLKQTSEMGEIGCNRCHQVESSCASCHGNHVTDLRAVQNPNVCAKCHMGPDHPQWEMWQTSQHGTLFVSLGGEVAPDCQRCHMPAGTHDVSRGITLTPAGAPVEPELQEQRRMQMLEVCSECHARGFAERDLARADAVLQQSREIVEEAEKIVWDLYDRKLLEPMPENRPEHPLRGRMLVTDGQMLYEDTSRIERILFKMKKFDFAKTWKGGYHQNPAYTHWYGNAELKMDLVDIRSEALRLQGRTVPVSTSVDQRRDVEAELDTLKRKFSRGAISGEEYEEKKRTLLEQEFGRDAKDD